jgi:hypothetical protein
MMSGNPETQFVYFVSFVLLATSGGLDEAMLMIGKWG